MIYKALSHTPAGAHIPNFIFSSSASSFALFIMDSLLEYFGHTLTARALHLLFPLTLIFFLILCTPHFSTCFRFSYKSLSQKSPSHLCLTSSHPVPHFLLPPLCFSIALMAIKHIIAYMCSLLVYYLFSVTNTNTSSLGTDFCIFS